MSPQILFPSISRDSEPTCYEKEVSDINVRRRDSAPFHQ